MGTNTGIPGVSFSWRRALGITKVKRAIARQTGIPTTRSGRQRKFGALVGKLVGWPVILVMLLFSDKE